MFQVHGSRHTARDILARQIAGFDPKGDCSNPVTVRYRGSPDNIRVVLGLEKDGVAVAYYDVRCRKCPECLRHRQRLWKARGIAECAVSTRTWFGTLTVNPVERVRWLYRAQLRNDRRHGDRWETYDSDERYRRIAEIGHIEITLALKRLRKASGKRFRYLLVSEAHEDGFPHFHMLLHEHHGNISKRSLEAAWHSGFSQWRLVDTGDSRVVGYVCKYLSKSALTRVRASQRYGQGSAIAPLLAERLMDASEVLSEAVSQAKTSKTGPSTSTPSAGSGGAERTGC